MKRYSIFKVVLFKLISLVIIFNVACGSGGSTEEQSSEIERGKLLASSSLAFLSKDELLSEYGTFLSPEESSAVALYKIVYETVDPFGNRATATGVVAIPQGISESLPMLSWQHGTTFLRDNVASVYGFDIVSAVLGGLGYVTVLPDYLGYGDSSLDYHPYVQGNSLGTSVVDMLRATKTLLEQVGVNHNGQLFLLGYSEGGYATMAAHREIEQNTRGEFSITASAPMAGTYDPLESAKIILRQEIYEFPAYITGMLHAYERIYALDSVSEILQEPYASRLALLHDGTVDGETINENLTTVVADLFTESFLTNFLSEAGEAELKEILASNRVDDWVPQAPMRLYHCLEDEYVPYENSENAFERFISLGAEEVELITLDFGGHDECGFPSVVQAIEWFEEF